MNEPVVSRKTEKKKKAFFTAHPIWLDCVASKPLGALWRTGISQGCYCKAAACESLAGASGLKLRSSPRSSVLGAERQRHVRCFFTAALICKPLDQPCFCASTCCVTGDCQCNVTQRDRSLSLQWRLDAGSRWNINEERGSPHLCVATSLPAFMCLYLCRSIRGVCSQSSQTVLKFGDGNWVRLSAWLSVPVWLLLHDENTRVRLWVSPACECMSYWVISPSSPRRPLLASQRRRFTNVLKGNSPWACKRPWPEPTPLLLTITSKSCEA